MREVKSCAFNNQLGAPFLGAGMSCVECGAPHLWDRATNGGHYDILNVSG